MRAIAIALLLAAAPAHAAVPTPEARTRKEQGDARREAGDATGALAAYREALTVTPDYIEAWEEIGKLYFGSKNYREAAESFQRAVDIDGTHANNWFNLALAVRKAGDLGRARDAFRRYLLLKPEDAEARLRLADVLRGLGEREAALREYRAVVAAADARTVAPALGDRAKEAIAQVQAEASSPGAVPATPPLTTPAAPSGGAPPAVSIVPAVPAAEPVAVPVAPTPPPAASRPIPEPPRPASPALLDKLALGDRLLASGDYRGALFAYQDAVYLDPKHAMARVKLGRAYWILRYVAQADDQWSQAAQLAPNDPSVTRIVEETRSMPRPTPPPPPAGSNGGTGAANAPTTPAANGPAAAGGGGRVYRFVPEGATNAPPIAPAAPLPQLDPGGSTPGYGMPSGAAPSGYAQPQNGQAPYGQPYGQQYGQPAAQPPQSGNGAQQGYGQPSQPPSGYAQPAYAQPQYGQPAYPPSQQPGQPLQPQPGGYGMPPAPGLQDPPSPSASLHAAAQRYRAAISLYTQRDYLGAIAELDAAITLDPNLSVAYTARGSARFGLGKLREAAADYKAALDLDPSRAEPIWGLAECQRMLRDPAAPDTYRRYAASLAGDVNEERRARARRWATELSPRER